LNRYIQVVLLKSQIAFNKAEDTIQREKLRTLSKEVTQGSAYIQASLSLLTAVGTGLSIKSYVDTSN